jgi:N-acyl-D-aspartate/D-glutamate deacylase
MRGIRTGGKWCLLLAAAGLVLVLTACSSDDEGDKKGGVPSGGDSSYDLVITNGRVIDPLSGTDTIATVAVLDGTIDRITPDPDEGDALAGRAARVIDASGRVVSPGFINTHTHEGVIQESMKVYVKDGITTWVGGNCGFSSIPLADYYEGIEQDGLYNNYASLTGLNALREEIGLGTFEEANEAQIAEMVEIFPPIWKQGAWASPSARITTPAARMRRCWPRPRRRPARAAWPRATYGTTSST